MNETAYHSLLSGCFSALAVLILYMLTSSVIFYHITDNCVSSSAASHDFYDFLNITMMTLSAFMIFIVAYELLVGPEEYHATFPNTEMHFDQEDRQPGYFHNLGVEYERRLSGSAML